MADFDPDAYLKQYGNAASPATSSDFDPDAYLKQYGDNNGMLPDMVQKAAQVISTPIRGWRALGVGAEKLVSAAGGINPIDPVGSLESLPGRVAAAGFTGDNASSALDSAAAAAQPGYKPKPGEKLGAAVGETIGGAALTAPLLPAEGAGLVMSVFKNALSGATLSAVQQAAEDGRIDPNKTKVVATASGLLPMVFPAASVIGNFLRQFTRAQATWTTNLTKATVDEIMENPKLLQLAQGTQEAVDQKVENVQKALAQTYDNAGQALNAVKAKLGIGTPDLSDSVGKMAAGETKTRPLSDIMSDYQSMTSDKTLTPQNTMKELMNLRQEMGDYINWSKAPNPNVPQIGSFEQGVLKRVYDDINTRIESLPGGKILRNAERGYGMMRDTYDALQRQLATPGEAEDALVRMFKGGNSALGAGKQTEMLNLLKKVEDQTGKPIVEPLMQELAAKNLKNLSAKRPVGAAFAALGPENIAAYLRAGHLLGTGLDEAAKSTGRAVGPLIPSVTNSASEQDQ